MQLNTSPAWATAWSAVSILEVQADGITEKEQINKMFEELYNKLKWQTKEKRKTQVILWKKIIGKAMLTKREAYGVMGLLRKLLGPEKKVVKKPKKKKVAKKKPVKKKIVKKKTTKKKPIKKKASKKKK